MNVEMYSTNISQNIERGRETSPAKACGQSTDLPQQLAGLADEVSVAVLGLHHVVKIEWSGSGLISAREFDVGFPIEPIQRAENIFRDRLADLNLRKSHTTQ
jgi:hypothetical protein